MNLRDRTVFGAYLLSALGLVAVGIRYLTASTFMAYHAAALQREWADFSPNEQAVFLAALRGVGGGFVTGGISVALLLIPYRRGERWARWAIPALMLLCGLSALNASLTVALQTPSSPPWQWALAMIAIACAGLVISSTERR